MLGVALLGCTRTSTPPPVIPEGQDRCLIPAVAGERRETLTVALADPVDAGHAPVPTNDSEQLLFGELFETLVQVDCEGRLHPGLATAWRADSARRIWTFSLRAGPHSSDSTSNAAAGILSSWRDRPAALKAHGIETAFAQDDGRLSVTMRDPLDSVPRLFADPALALSHDSDSGAWQINGDGVPLVPTGSGLVVYRQISRVDPRDALDQGADLMVTRDPALVEYAARRPAVETFPLPWSRTYILLQPRGADPMPRAVGPDAARADARAAEPPFWWEHHSQRCGESLAPSSRPGSSRVAYLDGDNVAQALAERVVALASPDSDLRTLPLGPAEFSASVANGVERAYIIAVPRQSLAPCRDSAGWPAGAAIYPLIDTRAHAIVRRGTRSLRVDWDGTVRLLPEAEHPRGHQ